ncbi:MAG: hypothetical protein SGJ27_10330 [Candidatus Melainabacteria bacterium]|mgnify:CR=1 FL=1|nr:hypothetical protein [Candidatus Melainabacteria bacterium]
MHLADIGVKCHNCGISFKSKQIPLIVDTGQRNSELRLIIGGVSEQFEPYSVCTCPSCGLADWATAFGKTDEQAVLNQALSTPHLQFRTAALAAERTGKSFHAIGLFYLYAAWCADDINAIPQAREYRRLAVDAFYKSLTDGSCPPAQRAEIEYLIGELLRRSGDFVNSVEYYKEVVPRLPSKYAMMARKVMRLCQEGRYDAIPFD